MAKGAATERVSDTCVPRVCVPLMAPVQGEIGADRGHVVHANGSVSHAD
jgi:hypothetical protein